MLLFVLRPSLAFSRLLDSLVLVGVLLKRRGPHYTHNFDSERETIMATRKRVGEVLTSKANKCGTRGSGKGTQ